MSGQLLIVFHSRTGSITSLCNKVAEGVIAGSSDGIVPRVLKAQDAAIEDVLGADAIILGTPANFGYMSGMLKDFFERIYEECLDMKPAMPWGLVAKGKTDVDGAITSIERIVGGLKWKMVVPALKVVGPIKPEHLDCAFELGATMSAGLEAGIF